MKTLIGLLMISYPALAADRPAQSAAFEAFAPQVKLRWDEKFLYVESNGLPAHNMMVGITSWQQQVPLPQAYSGDNAWRIPLHPVPAKEPQMIEGHFLRGAIALAANGIPIFNPQNNRGEVSHEIGELDEWGGHCGRADDYHYHIAPLHLQRVLGKSRPIAWALDGYPVYGLTEPDGSPVGTLDKCHGHESAAIGYHYHAATRRPYLQSAFHGEVVERDGQVDPQPRAKGVREAQPPLRGAEITAFASTGANNYKLDYTVNSDKRSISYSINPDGTYPFVFDNGRDGTTKEIYSQRAGGSGGPKGKGGTGKDRRPGENPPPAAASVTHGNGSFTLRSPDLKNGGILPIDYTGDGSGATPPLEWSGAPVGTKSYALIMHHLDPEGAVKWYWTLYDIPENVTSLPKNVKGIGKVGTGFRGRIGYEPPHSKGPGAKTYTLTLYALSAPVKVTVPPSQVNREVLLAAIQGSVLANSDLNVVYTRNGTDGDSPAENRPRSPRQEGGAGAADNPDLVKPAITDTIQASVYADNWFKLYINGKLVAVDPIDFLPHNVVNVELLPEYPMTIAVMVKDNADPKTGMEYGNHIGDGGFIIKFSDGTVSNAKWKAKGFFKGPLNHDVANPKVEHTPIPKNWFATNFDDSQWPNATEYTEQRVKPKESFYKADFAGAKFIWTADLDLDNTILFRTKIEKRGWQKRWNTKPDLIVTDTPWLMKNFHLLILATIAVFTLIAAGPDDRKAKKGGGAPVESAVVPPYPFNVWLCRPGADAVTASVIAWQEMEGFISFGESADAMTRRTGPVQLRVGTPVNIVLDGLKADTRYFYQLNHRSTGGELAKDQIRSFHTQRSEASPFTFDIQADSHLDASSDVKVYQQTLANMVTDKPDFMIDLGDTTMVDKFGSFCTHAESQYRAQRYYIGGIAHSVHVFLTLGNHDGEQGFRLTGEPNSMPLLSLAMRKKYLPNPEPGGIYTGNATPQEGAGLLQDHYAWEWGGGLFVVLDPFWFTRDRKGDDTWGMTLGEAQFRWLTKTLETSKTPFKFIFIHHLVGGLGRDVRGGVKPAPYMEWGGKNADGTDGFAEHRPGWEMPIHQLLVKHGVSIVFHGHDHLYAKEELDGIIYQEVPQPSHPSGGTRSAEEYGYTGVILGSSGHLRVKVDPKEAVVEYVRAGVPGITKDNLANGSIAHRYSITPRTNP